MTIRTILFVISLLSLFSAGLPQNKYPKDELPADKVEFIRTIFYEAVESSDKNDEMYEYIEKAIKNHRGNSAFLTAYLGASETLVAKHSYNPYTKWNSLNKGLEKIGGSINKYRESLELRFLRFSILHYLPGFLGFSKERNEDLASLYSLLLKRDYEEVSYEVQEGIINFLIESERLTTGQVQKLKSLILARK